MAEPPITADHQSPEDDEVSLLDIFIVVAKHKKLILGITFFAAVAAALYSLAITPIYTAKTKILPPQQNQSTAAGILAQLGGLGGVASGALGIRTPNDLYIGMLKSRTVADNLIRRFDLNAVFGQKLQSRTQAILESRTKITSGKDGIITIEMDDDVPKRAAELANAYVDELHKLTQTLAVTEASQRRLFFERQLELARKNLANAEILAQQGLDKGGLVIVDAQGKVMAETTAKLRAQIAVKEIQINAMRAFAADQNPDLHQAQFELDAMKKALSKIEGPAYGGDTKSAIAPGGTGSLNLLRDMRYRETIVDLLTRQYEYAKIDEAKDTSIIQVLDMAIEPDLRSKPHRRLIVLLSAFVALIAGVLCAFGIEAMAKVRSDPEQMARLQAIKRYLAWR